MVILSATTPDLMGVGRVKHILIDDTHADAVYLWVEKGVAVRNSFALYFEVLIRDRIVQMECIDVEKLLSYKPQYCIGKMDSDYFFFLKSGVIYN